MDAIKPLDLPNMNDGLFTIMTGTNQYSHRRRHNQYNHHADLMVFLFGGGGGWNGTGYTITEATTGQLYQSPNIIVNYRPKAWRGKNDVLGEILPQRRFVHHKSHMT
jgi:hypothetical protein